MIVVSPVEQPTQPTTTQGGPNLSEVRALGVGAPAFGRIETTGGTRARLVVLAVLTAAAVTASMLKVEPVTVSVSLLLAAAWWYPQTVTQR